MCFIPLYLIPTLSWIWFPLPSFASLCGEWALENAGCGETSLLTREERSFPIPGSPGCYCSSHPSESQKVTPCFSISGFSTQGKWKKDLKSCPLPKVPFSRHMDKLHRGYLSTNLWFLWEIVRHVLYSRYKKHNFCSSVRSVHCETSQLLLHAFN